MEKLTEQEKQDVIRYLDAGKPLPDKYRFLLFEDKREVELVWNGKTSEVCNIVLPFQVIEQVDEPREEKPVSMQVGMFDTDSRGRQLKGWTNKLIWGDNKLILSSLKNGPMREEIEKQGGIKLIYIDPPFDVGADFSMDIEIGDETFTKNPNVLEEIAYRDTWGKGADSFISMIYERLVLMRDLLAEDGSIYVHCDWRVSGYIRLILDEVFAKTALRNHILWLYSGGGIPTNEMPKKHDDIFWYTKGESWIYNTQYRPYSEGTIQRGRTAVKGPDALLREEGTPINNWWPDVKKITSPTDPEKLYYPTQKSEELLSRIINLSSNEGDLVADFFCGSGTTAAVAEKLGRKWIVTDLGKFAIHTTRKRMIGVQRQLKAEGRNYRAFELLNLGKYERQHYIGVNPNLREVEKARQLEEKANAFVALILRAYRAEKVEGFGTFHGKKAGRLVAVGPVNLPVTRLFVEEVILECRKKRFTKVDILGFEFEMGLFPNVLDEAKAKGIDIAPKYIPAEVFDKRAVEKGQVVFHDVSFVEVTPHVRYLDDREGSSDKRASEPPKSPLSGGLEASPLSGGLSALPLSGGLEVSPREKGTPYKGGVSSPPDKGGEVRLHIQCPPDKGGTGGYIPYNPDLKEKARENRKNPTPAEKRLWFDVLQDKRLANLKFTRQKPLDKYIVDFYCAALMMAVEIDGDTHAEQADYDRERTENLKRYGIEVIRYANRDVLNNIEGVWRDLLEKVWERQGKPPKSPLSGGLGASHLSGGLARVSVELTDFSVFYSQDSIAQAESTLKDKASRIIVEKGRIVKVSKDKDGIVKREVLTKKWTDWVDYWAVDFDFESKREIIRVQNPESSEWEEVWTGDYIFENEWQSFRTKKDRSLELKSATMECPPGRRKIAVKVVDIFGNDTMKIIEVKV